MNERLDTVIALIQKLRALGTSTNVHEAASAAAKADALIAKHQLSEMDLQIKEGSKGEPIEIVAEPLYESGRAMLWVHQLAHVLCDAYGCTYYVSTISDAMKVAQKNPNARRATYKAFILVGRKSDTEILRYMFTWLQEEIVSLTKQYAYGQGMAASQSFALGAVKGIEMQLKQQHETTVREAARAGQSSAMVLLDNRSKEASVYLKQKIKLKAGQRSQLRTDSSMYDMGTHAGKNISLNKGLGAGTPGDTKRLK